MELDLYRERIKLLARTRDGTPIYNGSPDHAAVIIENIFNVAQDEVRLLSGDLNSRVYGAPGVVQRATEFLAHSHRRLRVLLERETYSPTHPLVAAMSARANVQIAVIPDNVRGALQYHFATADDDCFRFEPEKDKHVAVAAFGDQPATHNLNGIFESIWELSEQRPIAVFAE